MGEDLKEHDASEDLKILVVDDDVVFCRALAGALRRRGNEVLVANDVASGKSELTAWAPGRLVVDLRMPDGSGLEILQFAREHFPDTQVVILTGYGSIATAVEAVKQGAVQYLTKPVSADDVLAAFDGVSPEVDVQAPSLDEVEWEHLQRIMKECDQNVSEAARRLGLHRRTLQRKLARGR